MYVVGSAINNITHQLTQMLGFLAGSAVIFAVGTHQALAIDSVTFVLSAVIVVAGVRRRPAPRREGRARESLWQISRRGGRLVLGDRTLRPLVCFAWLCGFYVLPEGLAAPYAKTFGDSPFIVGLLMSAMPTGMVVGAFAYSRFVRPDNRLRLMGWMAMLACAPLIGSGLRPPLWAVVALWALSGVGCAYQVAANAAFVAAVPRPAGGRRSGWPSRASWPARGSAFSWVARWPRCSARAGRRPGRRGGADRGDDARDVVDAGPDRGDRLDP